MLRLNAGGAMSVNCFMARNIAWSCAVQSVSRFCMKLAIDGNAWLLTVVSMWNTRTVSSMSWPWRMQDWCSAESGGVVLGWDAKNGLLGCGGRNQEEPRAPLSLPLAPPP